MNNQVVRIRNDSSEMERVLTSFDAFAERNKVPEKVKATFIMALDEMVSNSIKYGYDDAGQHEIAVSFSILDGILEAQIVDDGHEFDPFSQDEPDTTLGIEEREIGGLGLLLVKQLTDEHSYERRDGKNYVKIRKRL